MMAARNPERSGLAAALGSTCRKYFYAHAALT